MEGVKVYVIIETLQLGCNFVHLIPKTVSKLPTTVIIKKLD
jgi:hypothetical protein